MDSLLYLIIYGLFFSFHCLSQVAPWCRYHRYNTNAGPPDHLPVILMNESAESNAIINRKASKTDHLRLVAIDRLWAPLIILQIHS
jgi:hypothetical protein